MKTNQNLKDTTKARLKEKNIALNEYIRKEEKFQIENKNSHF